MAYTPLTQKLHNIYFYYRRQKGYIMDKFESLPKTAQDEIMGILNAKCGIARLQADLNAQADYRHFVTLAGQSANGLVPISEALKISPATSHLIRRIKDEKKRLLDHECHLYLTSTNPVVQEMAGEAVDLFIDDIFDSNKLVSPESSWPDPEKLREMSFYHNILYLCSLGRDKTAEAKDFIGPMRLTDPNSGQLFKISLRHLFNRTNPLGQPLACAPDPLYYLQRQGLISHDDTNTALTDLGAAVLKRLNQRNGDPRLAYNKPGQQKFKLG